VRLPSSGLHSNVVAQIARVRDRVDDRLMQPPPAPSELELHVQRAGREEGMDARALRPLERFPRAVDILRPARARPQTMDSSPLAATSRTASKSPFDRDRETGLDDIDAHFLERLGHAQFLPRDSSSSPAIARRRAAWCRKCGRDLRLYCLGVEGLVAMRQSFGISVRVDRPGQSAGS